VPAGAVHGVGHHTQFAAGDDVQVDEGAELFVVGPGGVEFDDLALADGFVEVYEGGFPAGLQVLGQEVFDAQVLFPAGAAAIGRLQFDAVVAGGVVAGGDHDPGRGFFVDDGVADGRGGRVGAGQPGLDAVGGHD